MTAATTDRQDRLRDHLAAVSHLTAVVLSTKDPAVLAAVDALMTAPMGSLQLAPHCPEAFRATPQNLGVQMVEAGS
jgi:hypothetical protein